jgi:hypothetical protein
MKILQKIRLINWHFFEDATFDVKGNTLIYGENACGKSTIIDAIHYVLSGGDCDFNKAANSTSSSRSVFSYMKARVGKETQEYARPQTDIISHIALQFLDDFNNQPIVVGVVLQIASDQQPTNRFYSFKGSPISDDLFYADEGKSTIRNGDNFFDFCTEKGIDIQSIDNDGRAKTCADRMTAVLEVSQTYPPLLEKAISFSSLGGIDDFARKFLFKEDQLRIEDLIKPAMDYQRIKEQLEGEEKKIESLNLVAQLAPKYRETVKDQSVYDLISAKEEVAIQANNCDIKKGELEKHELLIKDDENQKEILDERQEILNRRDKELSNNNPAVDAYKAAQNAEKSAQESLGKANISLENLNYLVASEKLLANELNISEDFTKAIADQNYDAFLGSAKHYNDEVQELKDTLIKTNTILGQQLSAKKDNNKNLELEIGQLKQNINCPAPVRLLIEQIKEECLRHGIDEAQLYVIPVADVLEVTDESWRRALEGLLGVFRFDLLVPNVAYPIAHSVFLKNPGIKDYFGFGVLNEEKLFGEFECPDSVTSYLKSDNKLALNYIRKLFGDIKPVDSIQSQNSDGREITKDGLFFDGYAIRRLTESDMARPYLGQASKRLSLEIDQKKLESLVKEISSLETDINKNANTIAKIKESKAQVIARSENVFFQIKQAEANYNSAHKQLEILSNDQSLLSAQEAIKSLANDLEAYKKDRKCFEEKKTRDDTRKGEMEKELEFQKQNLTQASAELEELEKTLADNVKTIDLEPYKKGEKGTKLLELAAQQRSLLHNQEVDLQGRLTKLFGEFNSQFGGDITPTIDNLDDYLAVYNKAVTIDVVSLKPQVEEAHQNMEKVFKENFADKLLDKIKWAKDTASQLNSVLKKYQFGTEKGTFQLVIKTTENQDYQAVSEILEDMRTKIYGNAGVYDTLDDAEKQAFDKIFAVLLDNRSGVDNSKLIAGYCDYRNYMSYDIKETRQDGSVSSYKHNQNAFSGGETQTPFYVMVAAAFGSGFLARFAKKSSPCGLVILDEAFNTMDEDRIKATVEFYKQLDIQLIICVPTDRSALLAGKVDTSIALVRDGTQVGWYTTYHE